MSKKYTQKEIYKLPLNQKYTFTDFMLFQLQGGLLMHAAILIFLNITK